MIVMITILTIVITGTMRSKQNDCYERRLSDFAYRKLCTDAISARHNVGKEIANKAVSTMQLLAPCP
jgi:hypothetical protein